MKLMIASDIHGSIKWCRQLFSAFDNEGPEKLLLLGDLLYHGPRNDLPEEYDPKEVIELLNSKKDKLLCVRGNCEAEVDQMVLDFPVMNTALALFLDGFFMYATHGHIENPDSPPKLNRGSILLNGHTHIPAFENMGEFIYINPGSVSIPKENTHRSYIIYEAGHFYFKTLSGETYMEYDINNL